MASLEHTIGEKFVLGKKIGSGAFGEIFIGMFSSFGHVLASNWLSTIPLHKQQHKIVKQENG